MTKHRWSAEDKLLILQEAETMGVAPTCRKHGISGPTFYKWKHRLEEDGLDGLKPKKRGPHFDPEIARLEKENGQLKKLLAEKELALQIKEDLLKKTFLKRMSK